jgi:hypothetical protein
VSALAGFRAAPSIRTLFGVAWGDEAMKGTRLLAMVVSCVAILATLAAAASSQAAHTELIGLDTYIAQPGDFEATRLERLNADFSPGAGPRLKLGDGASGAVFSPDRRLLALGSVNFGEIILVDPSRLRRVATTLTAGKSPRLNYEATVVNWPRRHLLVALTSPSPGKYPVRAAVVLCDPLRGKVLRTIPLRGGGTAVAAGSRTVVAVGATRGIAPQRIVIVGSNGSIRTVTLKRITEGYKPPAGKRFYTVTREPAFAVSSTDIFVVGVDRTVATIDLRTLHVSYHYVPRLWDAHLRPDPPYETGTSGSFRSATRIAEWLGHGQLLAYGENDAPVPPRSWQQRVGLAASIIDTHRWRISHVFDGFGSLRPLGTLLLGADTSATPRRSSGSWLTAFSRSGKRVYQVRKLLWWDVIAGRLVAGDPYGNHLFELDPHTGQRIRTIGPAPFWPLAAIAWRQST